MTFLFEVDSAELSSEAQSELRALAEALHGDGSDIQVLGFASGRDASDDHARKLALSRALKVRSFLIDAGIASARIRVRLLGDHSDGGPAHRVAINTIGRDRKRVVKGETVAVGFDTGGCSLIK